VLTNARVVKVDGEMALLLAGTTGLRVRIDELPEKVRAPILVKRIDDGIARLKRAQTNDEEVTPPTRLPVPDRQYFEVIDVSMRVTEKSDDYWRVAWKVKVRNNSTTSVSEAIKVQFVDRDGFEIDYDFERNVYVPGGQSKDVTGNMLIKAGAAATITRATAKWER
jgi:hypothetical protein